MAAREQLQAACVLHTRAYRNTSLLVDLFTPQHGRICVVARSARGPKSRFRGILQPFSPLLVSWVGQRELKTLTHAELTQTPLRLSGKQLACGFYVNELIYKFCHRDDPHPHLYQVYVTTLHQLMQSHSLEIILRCFEMDLLNEIGYGINFRMSIDGPVSSDAQYRYDPRHGFHMLQHDVIDDMTLSGKHLLAIAARQLVDDEVLSAAKQILRQAIHFHLDHDVIQSRQLFA